MNAKYVGLICGVLGLFVVFYPENTNKPTPDPVKPVIVDNVSRSFKIYEDLWRKHALATADKIKAGDLKTEQEVWDFLAAGQSPARKVAFEELAKSEQDYFTKNGGWNAKKHEELLRSYVK